MTPTPVTLPSLQLNFPLFPCCAWVHCSRLLGWPINVQSLLMECHSVNGRAADEVGPDVTASVACFISGVDHIQYVQPSSVTLVVRQNFCAYSSWWLTQGKSGWVNSPSVCYRGWKGHDPKGPVKKLPGNLLLSGPFLAFVHVWLLLSPLKWGKYWTHTNAQDIAISSKRVHNIKNCKMTAW